MRLFLKVHKSWRNIEVINPKLRDQELEDWIKGKIIECNKNIKDKIDDLNRDRSPYHFYFPDEIEDGGSVIFFIGTEREFQNSRYSSSDWRYYRVPYKITNEGCCVKCAGTGVNAEYSFYECSYCDGTTVQVRQNIPRNFMNKSREISTGKAYNAWHKEYTNFRKALLTCRKIM